MNHIPPASLLVAQLDGVCSGPSPCVSLSTGRTGGPLKSCVEITEAKVESDVVPKPWLQGAV